MVNQENYLDLEDAMHMDGQFVILTMNLQGLFSIQVRQEVFLFSSNCYDKKV